MEGQYQVTSDPDAIKRLYPSYEPKHKKFSKIPLNCRNKKTVKDANNSVMKSSKDAGGTQTRGKGSISSHRDSKDIELKNGINGNGSLVHS